MTGGLENTGMDEQLLPDFLAVEERREKAYRLYCQGQSYRRIGVALGLGKSRAGELVNEALQERRDELKAKTEEVRARELAKLEHIYSETWEAYDRSKSEATETETRQEKRTVKGRGAGEARDHLLRQIADLKRTPAKGSAEERADLILNAYPGLTPTQKTEIRERIKANILG